MNRPRRVEVAAGRQGRQRGPRAARSGPASRGARLPVRPRAAPSCERLLQRRGARRRRWSTRPGALRIGDRSWSRTAAGPRCSTNPARCWTPRTATRCWTWWPGGSARTGARLVVGSGSLPPGLPVDTYARLCRTARDARRAGDRGRGPGRAGRRAGRGAGPGHPQPGRGGGPGHRRGRRGLRPRRGPRRDPGAGPGGGPVAACGGRPAGRGHRRRARRRLRRRARASCGSTRPRSQRSTRSGPATRSSAAWPTGCRPGPGWPDAVRRGVLVASAAVEHPQAGRVDPDRVAQLVGRTTEGSGRMKRPTLNDVAAEAGVSGKSVSRVINGAANISPELRRRVEAAVEKLNYVPEHAGPHAQGGHRRHRRRRHRHHRRPVLRRADQRRRGGRAGRRAGHRVRQHRLRPGPRAPAGRADGHAAGQGADPGAGPALARLPAPLRRPAADRHDRPGGRGGGYDTVRVDDRAMAQSRGRAPAGHGHRRIAFVGGDQAFATSRTG